MNDTEPVPPCRVLRRDAAGHPINEVVTSRPRVTNDLNRITLRQSDNPRHVGKWRRKATKNE
jgi:hypothetical protein